MSPPADRASCASRRSVLRGRAAGRARRARRGQNEPGPAEDRHAEADRRVGEIDPKRLGGRQAARQRQGLRLLRRHSEEATMLRVRAILFTAHGACEPAQEDERQEIKRNKIATRAAGRCRKRREGSARGDDEHRYRRAVHELLGHRPEQRARERPLAVGADDDQACGPRLGNGEQGPRGLLGTSSTSNSTSASRRRVAACAVACSPSSCSACSVLPVFDAHHSLRRRVRVDDDDRGRRTRPRRRRRHRAPPSRSRSRRSRGRCPSRSPRRRP